MCSGCLIIIPKFNAIPNLSVVDVKMVKTGGISCDILTATNVYSKEKVKASLDRSTIFYLIIEWSEHFKINHKYTGM